MVETKDDFKQEKGQPLFAKMDVEEELERAMSNDPNSFFCVGMSGRPLPCSARYNWPVFPPKGGQTQRQSKDPVSKREAIPSPELPPCGTKSKSSQLKGAGSKQILFDPDLLKGGSIDWRKTCLIRFAGNTEPEAYTALENNQIVARREIPNGSNGRVRRHNNKSTSVMDLTRLKAVVS